MKLKTGFKVKARRKQCANCSERIVEREVPALMTKDGIKMFCSTSCKKKYYEEFNEEGHI